MNFLRRLTRTQNDKFSPSSIPKCSNVIEDHLPASAFLGSDQQPITEITPHGNIPLALTQKVCLRFRLIPREEVITGIRLRLGTYCRNNHCHITVQLNDFTHTFSAHELVDNEYIDIFFSAPQICLPGQPTVITIYSSDATEDHVIAVWCTKMSIPFINKLTSQPLHLPEVPHPRVSIIIPIFNKALYTYNCLLTVQDRDPHITKEVIIINNASTDETTALLEQLQGAFKIINNIENKGFVNACRQGAEVASGEFILFLNNDTQVMPGWLSNLVKIMDTHPEVGITGSKLIYPDGRLQEAGGIIFNDASGWNYGRLQDPTDPKFNRNRPVDYCSGASLMIRKTLWEQLGGFDERYAPAYYEDTDLCFAIRQAGYQVFYCHDSEVIHHEGITAGTDVQSGYKIYQAINQKKFQAKWWKVLATHPAPPPQTSPDAAAFRFITDEPLTFRLPDHKILATHLLGQGWAANFWSYLSLHQVDEELQFIKTMGFNTVILLIPWVGFQTQVEPITYHTEYFIIYKQLLEKIQFHGLHLILRLGYSHDNGPHSEPKGFLRQVVIGTDPVILTAWCDYLDQLWDIAKTYPNLLGGFISWEDFFLMDLTHISYEKRLKYAELTGYQHFLIQNYTLEEISARYQQPGLSYDKVFIPAFKSNGIDLFSEFWDNLLIEKIFPESKKHFPLLTMEIRVDCDPQEDSHICHENTFDISSDTPITMIYYSPAWGAPNDGKPDSAENILKRMQRLFESIHTKTNNVIFIDQFNFIDNTPDFEYNTEILPTEIPNFLTGVTSILQQQSIGYGMWTLRDVRVNFLRNGLFERNYPSWEINNGEITFDSDTQTKAVLLNSDGTLNQLITCAAGVPLSEEKLSKLDFKAKKLEKTDKAIVITVLVVNNNNDIVFEDKLCLEGQDWQEIHLENLPFNFNYQLKLKNQGTALLLTDFYLYQLYQENGIIDANGKPKPFYNDLVSLNRILNKI